MSIDDTTTSTVPPGDVQPTPLAADPEPWRPSWRWLVAGILMALLLAAVLFLFLVQASVIGQDDYVLAPGSATDTAPAVLVEGAPTFDPEGEIAFTTVTIKRNVTVWEWLRARRDSASELVPAEQIDGSRTADETRQVTQFQMDQSQDTATLVALNFLGYEIVPEVEGAFVVQLVDDSPAQAVLRLGDLITDVNGTPVRSSEDLGDTIRSFEPGDEVVVSLRRAREGGRDGSDENAEELDFTIVLAENAQNPDAGFLGVQIQTPVRADAPFDVGFDVGRVRGPSAGLAFSLAIVDVLSEGELTGGNKVATTGTIDAGGNVGAVGGVPQKIEAAKRADVQLFLVPPSEYEDAIAAAGDDIDVLCVQTFDDAILALAEIGGNGVETAEAFGAPAPQRSPNPVNPDDGFLSCAEVIGAQVADR